MPVRGWSRSPTTTVRDDYSGPFSLARRCSEHQTLCLVLHGSGVVIPMVIQTIQLALSEPNWTDDTSHVTSLDPTGADQSDAEHQPTDLAVGGSSPSRRATKPQVKRYMSAARGPSWIASAPVWSALLDDQG